MTKRTDEMSLLRRSGDVDGLTPEGHSDGAGVPAAGLEPSREAVDRASEMMAMGHLQEAMEVLAGPLDPELMPRPAKRGPGRPRGRKYRKISITIEEETLSRLDELAKLKGTSRSGIFQQIASEGVVEPTGQTG